MYMEIILENLSDYAIEGTKVAIARKDKDWNEKPVSTEFRITPNVRHRMQLGVADSSNTAVRRSSKEEEDTNQRGH
jgi:hypothetical protein